MSGIISKTVTARGTVVERFLDTTGNFPFVHRTLYPASGSKMKHLGFDKFCKVTCKEHPEYNMYSVIHNGKKKIFSAEELKGFVKGLLAQKYGV